MNNLVFLHKYPLSNSSSVYPSCFHIATSTPEFRKVEKWDFALGSSMYDYTIVEVTDRRCHLAAARNAIRLHHHHHINDETPYISGPYHTTMPFQRSWFFFVALLLSVLNERFGVSPSTLFNCIKSDVSESRHVISLYLLISYACHF